MSALVEARGLCTDFSLSGGFLRRSGAVLRAVDRVSLHVEEGETLGLVGESGCGKSTLGRTLIRLIEPSAGSIAFDGDDVTRIDAGALRQLRRHVQIVFQDPYGALDPRMSVEEIVMEPLLIHGSRRNAATRAKIDELLERVGLSPRHKTRYPHEFSGGQRQRIGIARALALRPRFVVCDEPVSALDVSVQAQIVNLLQDLQSAFGLTYLFIAHDLSVVRHISDRVAVMYLGQIVETAAKHALYGTPLHPYTQALIAAVPVAHPALRRPRAKIRGEIPSALDPPSGCRFHTRCPHVMAHCRTREPVMVEAAPGHHVACHLVAGS